jgi:hypothetical protein
MVSDAGSYGLPVDPLLAEVAVAMRTDRGWGFVFDPEWNLVYVTDELRRTFGGGQLAEFAIGAHFFGPENAAAARRWPYGANSPELMRDQFALVGDTRLRTARAGAMNFASGSTRSITT